MLYTVTFNPSLDYKELLLRCLPERPFLIKPNRAELETLAGTALNTEEELIEAAAAMLLTAEKEVPPLFQIPCPQGRLRRSCLRPKSRKCGGVSCLETGGDVCYNSVKIR